MGKAQRDLLSLFDEGRQRRATIHAIERCRRAVGRGKHAVTMSLYYLEHSHAADVTSDVARALGLPLDEHGTLTVRVVCPQLAIGLVVGRLSRRLYGDCQWLHWRRL